ncbi:hypothetical protein GCM10010272_66570 [Streptomyces lateritius]|nr:hypothetical protein GCM10010272_66570 [Streptomyces lateritius]
MSEGDHKAAPTARATAVQTVGASKGLKARRPGVIMVCILWSSDPARLPGRPRSTPDSDPRRAVRDDHVAECVLGPPSGCASFCPALATGEERLALGRLTAQDTALIGVLWRVGMTRVRRKSRKSSGRVQAAK